MSQLILWLRSWWCWVSGHHTMVDLTCPDIRRPGEIVTVPTPALLRAEYDPAHPKSPMYILSLAYCERCLYVPRP